MAIFFRLLMLRVYLGNILNNIDKDLLILIKGHIKIYKVRSHYSSLYIYQKRMFYTVNFEFDNRH
jgi:hypothetical protein